MTASGNASDAATAAINHTTSDNTGIFTLIDKLQKGTLSADDLATAQAAAKATATNLQIDQQNPTAVSQEGMADALTKARQAAQILQEVQALVGKQAAASSTPAAAGSTTHTVNIAINGRSQSVNVDTANDATTLTNILQQIAAAAGTAS